ncbi:dTDP-4-dehydrorhamnose 3,5-epimerase [Thalassospira profundimaris]|uniref:dTDP-4-dehydrorhamnose 3,5-epimerase n=1 Tax=Thalassospira profundimaris TaxID=502049 RepID=UPI000DEE028A|nr:dTDP-4-dehydrorhamnose 3,5-epimerase [Thalassospira profundimaris]
MPVEFDEFDIDGPVLFVPNRHRDKRGVFAETFRNDDFRDVIGEIDLVQENQIISTPINTLCGLHFQTSPYAQGRLVRVTQGAILYVAVDIRPRSETFGRHLKIELSAENWYQLWIPEGFAQGFKTLRPETHVTTKASNYYSPEHDFGIAWNDPDLGIDWELFGQQVVLSERDRHLPRLADLAPDMLGAMPPIRGFADAQRFGASAR